MELSCFVGHAVDYQVQITIDGIGEYEYIQYTSCIYVKHTGDFWLFSDK